MTKMDKGKTYGVTREILISCLICQILTNISVMAIGACLAVDPKKAELKGHGFIMLILSVMFLCILAAGSVGAIGEHYCILLLFAGLMVVGFLVGGLTHLMVFLTSGPHVPYQQLHLSLRDYENIKTVNNIWDSTQEQGKCCGITGPQDWLAANMKIPSSCCYASSDTDDIPSEHCSNENEKRYLYQKGCFKQVNNQRKPPAFIFKTDYMEFESLMKPRKKKKRNNYKEAVIYVMVFDYLSKIICIVAALTMAWLLW
ncbi:hypothetical protein HHI36_008865 [Cryptolaemus montrouzieri]|uniref:Tetraspanin n=1 Tax=Cryptolaemus montrouzieri TaxID=559131 RepID=A0ABD2MTK9_9CUCU